MRVTIGCRLPNGLILRHPNPDVKVEVKLNGRFSSKIVGATHATTEVDAEFWEVWKKAYHSYAPLKNGSIFEARSPQEADVKAKDFLKEKTGFEPLKQDEAGVKQADKD